MCLASVKANGLTVDTEFLKTLKYVQKALKLLCVC